MFGRENGAIVEDGRVTGETTQCVHCGRHWQVIRGSGRVRGMCLPCGGPTCGKKECESVCVPFKVQLDFMEGTRNRMDRYWDDWEKIMILRGVKGYQMDQRGMNVTESGILY